MDSLEKLNEVMQGAPNLAAEDEGTARLIQTLQVAGPILGQVIPETAEELDQALLGISTWMLSQRSDDAPGAYVTVAGDKTTGELNAERAAAAAAAAAPAVPAEDAR